MSIVILITGASSGIGFTTAKCLAEQGHKVYGAARRVEKMEELKQFGVTPIKMDVTSEESVNEAVEQVIAAEKRIDVLVNNAGYGSYGAVEDVSIDEARRQFEVNVFGLAILTKKVLPYQGRQCPPSKDPLSHRLHGQADGLDAHHPTHPLVRLYRDACELRMYNLLNFHKTSPIFS